MKKAILFRLVLLGLGPFALQSAYAGSAVALAPHNQMVTSFGHSREVAKQRALAEARRKYGADVRILASSDVTGYCAIAKARHPNGNWVIGVSLGNSSHHLGHEFVRTSRREKSHSDTWVQRLVDPFTGVLLSDVHGSVFLDC